MGRDGDQAPAHALTNELRGADCDQLVSQRGLHDTQLNALLKPLTRGVEFRGPEVDKREGILKQL
jgi:hypothetical protein